MSKNPKTENTNPIITLIYNKASYRPDFHECRVSSVHFERQSAPTSSQTARFSEHVLHADIYSRLMFSLFSFAYASACIFVV